VASVSRAIDPAAALRGALRQILRAQPPEMPRYAQLRHALSAAIESGMWSPGEQLPTEREIADMTGMSLGTVQRALATLQQNGVLRRLHGRGTFVSDGGAELEHNWHCRYLNDDETAFLPVYVRDVARGLAGANGDWQRYFPSNCRVFCIDRIIDVNGEFSAFGRLFFDARRFPRMARRPLAEMAGKNLKELLVTERPAAVMEKIQTLVLGPVPPHATRAMGLRSGAIAGMLQVIGRSATNETLYFYQLFVPPARRKLVIPGST
jgi:GntR family transcriptional regulator